MCTERHPVQMISNGHFHHYLKPSYPTGVSVGISAVMTHLSLSPSSEMTTSQSCLVKTSACSSAFSRLCISTPEPSSIWEINSESHGESLHSMEVKMPHQLLNRPDNLHHAASIPTRESPEFVPWRGSAGLPLSLGSVRCVVSLLWDRGFLCCCYCC